MTMNRVGFADAGTDTTRRSDFAVVAPEPTEHASQGGVACSTTTIMPVVSRHRARLPTLDSVASSDICAVAKPECPPVFGSTKTPGIPARRGRRHVYRRGRADECGIAHGGSVLAAQTRQRASAGDTVHRRVDARQHHDRRVVVGRPPPFSLARSEASSTAANFSTSTIADSAGAECPGSSRSSRCPGSSATCRRSASAGLRASMPARTSSEL